MTSVNRMTSVNSTHTQDAAHEVPREQPMLCTPVASAATAQYTAGTCLLHSVNSHTQTSFVRHVKTALQHYPYLRKRIATVCSWRDCQQETNNCIANYLLNSYICHELGSEQLRMLDEIFLLTIPPTVI